MISPPPKNEDSICKTMNTIIYFFNGDFLHLFLWNIMKYTNPSYIRKVANCREKPGMAGNVVNSKLNGYKTNKAFLYENIKKAVYETIIIKLIVIVLLY